MSEINHVVKDFDIGNTHIHICDDYCNNKSAADIEKILNRIASNAMTAISVSENEAPAVISEIPSQND